MTAGAHWTLEGKTALVTGGTRGIGRAIAEELASLGAAVMVVARNREGVDDFEARRGAGPERSGAVADLSTAEGRRAVVDQVRARWSRVDVLVNNVGTNIRKATLDYPEAEYEQLLATNLTSAFELTRLTHPLLRKAGKASVVNVGSVAGSRAVMTGAIYAMTKAALDQLTRYLAVEWGPEGIRVNSVLPWYTRTPLAAPVLEDPARLERILARTPLRRIAEPEEVARAVAFLAMGASSFVTGASLPVDGGFLALGL